MSITCPELDELDRLLGHANEMVQDVLNDCVERMTLIAEREISTRTPVNKYTTGGTLRASIQSEVVDDPGGVVGMVGTDEEYAPWVEEDTAPHEIRARYAEALAFHLVRGFQVVYRMREGGKRISRKRAMTLAGTSYMRRSFTAQRGRALYQRAGAKAGRLTATRQKAALTFAKSVRHPGTKGQHFFRDGVRATDAQAQALVRARLRRLLAKLAR